MRARAYFHDQGIVYDEFDVENDPQGRQGYNRLGRSGVPIILVGDRRIDGFSIARFQQLYSADN
jgi:glutaredoxin